MMGFGKFYYTNEIQNIENIIICRVNVMKMNKSQTDDLEKKYTNPIKTE